MSDHIVALRLVNGDEVITKVVDETDSHFVVKSPRILHLQFMQNGQAQAQMIPLFLQSNISDVYHINKSAVCAVAEGIASEHEKRYLGAISGLALAQ